MNIFFYKLELLQYFFTCLSKLIRFNFLIRLDCRSKPKLINIQSNVTKLEHVYYYLYYTCIIKKKKISIPLPL